MPRPPVFLTQQVTQRVDTLATQLRLATPASARMRKPPERVPCYHSPVRTATQLYYTHCCACATHKRPLARPIIMQASPRRWHAPLRPHNRNRVPSRAHLSNWTLMPGTFVVQPTPISINTSSSVLPSPCIAYLSRSIASDRHSALSGLRMRRSMEYGCRTAAGCTAPTRASTERWEPSACTAAHSSRSRASWSCGGVEAHRGNGVVFSLLGDKARAFLTCPSAASVTPSVTLPQVQVPLVRTGLSCLALPLFARGGQAPGMRFHTRT